MVKRFETKLLEEAFEFIQKQDIKARKKIFQNIRRAEQPSAPKFFKKLTPKFGNSGLYIQEFNIDF